MYVKRKFLKRVWGGYFAELEGREVNVLAKGKWGGGCSCMWDATKSAFPAQFWVVRTCGIEQFRLKYILR